MTLSSGESISVINGAEFVSGESVRVGDRFVTHTVFGVIPTSSELRPEKVVHVVSI